MAGEPEGPPAGRPLFFVSYAHTHWEEQTDPWDPDYWVDKFYGDLCLEVRKLMQESPAVQAQVPHGEQFAFIDRQLQVGDSWADVLAGHLAKCAVFVPLYTQKYFHRPDCGREWSIMRQRLDAHMADTGRHVDAIVPVIWLPVDLERMPGIVRQYHFYNESLGRAYLTEGLHTLIRLNDYRADYEKALRGIAKRIVAVVSQDEQLRPLRYHPSFRQLPDAFDAEADPVSANETLRITVAALDKRSALPEGRSDKWYGASATDWNPYLDHEAADGRPTVPIAWRVAEIAQRRDFDTHVTALTTHAEELRSGVAPSAPTILLVDAWAMLDSGWAAMLRKLDTATQDKGWIRIVLPWNAADTETVANEILLRAAIERTFGRHLSRGRIPSRNGEPGPISSAALGQSLDEAIRVVRREFIQHAAKFPPAGPYPKKPRLRGPAARGE